MGQHHRKHRYGHKHGESYSDCPPVAYPPTTIAPLAVPYPASVPSVYGPLMPYAYGGAVTAPSYGVGYSTVEQQEQLNQALADVRRHAKNERLGELGAAAAGAFAMYELHEARVDPAHARRHKLEAEVAGAIALGSAGYAYHEHLQKKKSEQIVQSLSWGSRRNDDHHQKHRNKDLMKKHQHHGLVDTVLLWK